MSAAKVAVFFYGSYMNAAVLAEVGIAVHSFEVATLHDFDIEIGALANLVRSEGRQVYGVLAETTAAELEQLYAHATNVLGGVYEPETVQVECRDGTRKAALCYIAPSLPARPAAPGYVERILAPARQHGFPRWYIEHLESFRPES